ncbi:amidohydrolase family protein [Polynucleobacter kasalickyi]|uniref:Predicted metal-dependent hydrolase, TIM-barrel fold n=1 Tax=Polynucleobacter kasalickyi TaxID=1938817 RepID=A0A1W2C2R6_9BURK|nr:amidohydrolase family protein [Polynucleobacter kasalickyi]SMC79314.1 Predicted metal-dependent hydrolase, TIM-barrel fold [Polynucleobacter kasalickyi]
MIKNIDRRKLLLGAGAFTGLSLVGCSTGPRLPDIFDAHCHIIDKRYPIVPNQGYVPPSFTLEEYRQQTIPLGITSGAIVSGSFHGYDQTYLRATLPQLGPRWVGITQVPPDVPDEEIVNLSSIGVRGLRFNVFRGRIDTIDDIVSLANRAHAVGKWHAEIYADSVALKPHVAKLSKLPQIVIDHMGMNEEGLPVILDLVDAGAKIKLTGFGRVNMNVSKAIERIAERNSTALMFGTDLPSTRAKRPFQASDIELIQQILGPTESRKSLWHNAVSLYKPKL